MTVVSFCDEVRAALDPIVVPHGFTCGQRGGSQVIFCAASDEFAARFPHLPQAEDQTGIGACVDLVVTADDDALGLGSVLLEGTSLQETLRGVGLADRADAVQNAMHGNRADALHGVAAALTDLFETSH
jgi:hypothetical protein